MPPAIATALLAGAAFPPLIVAFALWTLAAFLPGLRLVLLLSAPMALALGLGVPRDLLDAVETLAAVLFSLAPLLAYLGGAPTLRQLAVAGIVAAATLAAGLTPWGRTLYRSDLAAGALTLTLLSVALATAAAFLPRTSGRRP